MWHHDWRLQSLAFCSVSGPARPLVSSPRFSYVIHGLARAKTAPPLAFALLLVYSNSQFRQRLSESRLKVTQALYGSSLHLCERRLTATSRVSLAGSDGGEKQGRREPQGETPARQRVRRRGTPTRPPRIPPRAAPSAEEQLWPLLVTVWISRAVGIDFFPLALPAA